MILLDKNLKKIAPNVAIGAVYSICWMASSLGVSLLAYIHVNKLDQIRGLSVIGRNNYILWSTIFGPFSIPFALACVRSRRTFF